MAIDEVEKSEWQGVELLEVLAETSDREEQRMVLKLALKTFKHKTTSEFDALCDAGAIKVLLKCLENCARDVIDDVTNMFCQLIGVMLRCSEESAVGFFHQNGVELVTVLLLLFCNHSDGSLERTTRSLLIRLSRLRICLPLTYSARFLLRMMQQILRRHREGCHELASISCMFLSGWTIKQENKVLVARFPGLFGDTIRFALSPLCKDKSGVARFFSNMAWHIRDRSDLLSNDDVLKALELFLQSEDLTTNLAAIETIRQLATHPTNRFLISTFNKTSIVRALLFKLRREGTEMVATQAVMALIEKTTANRLVKRCPNLIPDLTSLSTEIDSEVLATVAAHSLHLLARHVSVLHDIHPIMMDALLLLGASPHSRIRFWAAKAIMEQTKQETNAFYIARTPILMKSVARLASDASPFVKTTATEALRCIASDSLSNKKRLVSNSEVMEVVVQNAQEVTLDHDSGRAAVQFILELIKHRSCEKRLAKHFGLVTSLSLYGTLPGGDADLRRASLKGVRTLAPLM